MSDCTYSTLSGITVFYVQLMSWAVYFIMLGAGFTYDTRRKKWGQQFTLTLYALWLTACQCLVYIFQYALNVQRVDPFCTQSTQLVFPSVPAFYAASGVAFVVFFARAKHVMLPWSRCVVLALVASCPFVLAFFSVNTWYEVLSSLLLGLGTTAIFFVLLARVLVPAYPYLLNSAPWSWCWCIDTWFMTPRACLHEERIRVAIKKHQ